jgi:hypothetical protein
VVGRKTALLRPDDPPGNGYERYREAWDLLREVAAQVEAGQVKYGRYFVGAEVDWVAKLGQSKKARQPKSARPGAPS